MGNIYYVLSYMLFPLGGLLVNICVARTMSIGNYSDYSYLMVLISYVLLFLDFGSKDYFLSSNNNNRDNKKDKSLVFQNEYYSVILLNSLLFFVFLLFFHFYERTDFSKLLLFSYFDIFSTFFVTKVILFYFQVNEKLESVFKYNVLYFFCSVLFKVALIIYIKELYLSLFFSGLLSSVSLILLFLSNNFRNLIDFKFSYTSALFKFRGWLPFAVSSISFLLYFNSDKVLVRNILGDKELAYYTIAATFVSLADIFCGVAWNILLPRVNRIFASKKNQIYLMCISYIGAALYIFVIYFFSSEIIILFFGSEYNLDIVNHLIIVLSFFFIFRYPNVILELKFIYIDSYNTVMKLRLLSAFINLILNVLFLQHFGLIWAAFTTVTSEMILTILFFLLLSKKRTDDKCLFSKL
ncbi:hypothetical protein C9J41_03230 [Photobacterium sp. GB-50]|uniref:oligosaccharide flippase family protein n=1 Tax=Photobacterium sp. GB-50 TaxID=2022107 RepID=UPI000D1627CF|nr:oligosaccharide flippase family protein [Photobacterium sp. GB-50]PSW74720.1 hypothetical protein C9J41_03230 [Photobacterium sp. GB-50]